MDIFEKTLSEMNFTFSSNEFSKRARKNGLSKQEISNGAIALFLHRNAVQKGSRRMWVKHNGHNSDKQKHDNVLDAINLLKSLGFKVLKRVTDWIEV